MKKTLEVINELKENGLIKDYAIGGAIAALRWTEPFLTEDLDIFIIPEKEAKEKEVIILSSVYEYFKKGGYTWKGHWIIIEGVPVDIFPVDELEKKAVEDAKEIDYEGTKTKVIAPEYLIALFLRAGRNKDIRKIEMILGQTKVDKEKLNEILNKYGLTEKFTNFMEKHYGK
ncbi:MAG: nucleotidyltransferase [bacterium]